MLNEPSVIALNRQTGEVLATGREAWQMIGRTPGYIVAVRPLRGGAITDFEITERMIRLLLQRVGVSRFTRPKVVICVPSAITEVERRAVTDAARRAGAAGANLIEQPMAAVGADLPIDEPVGNMVIDIGGGTSETAVISSEALLPLKPFGSVHSTLMPPFRTTSARAWYCRRRTNRRRDQDCNRFRSGDRRRPPQRCLNDLMSGLPKTVVLTPEEIREAIEDPVSSIVASVVRCLAKAPPNFPRLFGAGYVPRRRRRSIGLAARIERETEVPVRMSNVPLEAVVLGAGHVIEHYDALKGMFMGARR